MSSGCPSVVSMTKGRPCAFGSFRTFSRNSIPFIRGMFTSQTTSFVSGLAASFCRASTPSTASTMEKPALDSARHAAVNGSVTGGASVNRTYQEALRAFIEKAALEDYLDKNLTQPQAMSGPQLVQYQRLKEGLRMAIQFYGDPKTTADLPDRQI